MSVAFQFLDVVVLLVIVVSTVYATYRGFVSESLSIFAWAAAAFATLYFGPWAAYWMRDQVSPPWLGEVVGYGSVFLLVVIPLSFASFRFAQGIKKSQVSTFDSVLGFAFGVVRGLAIVGIAYLVLSAIVPIPDQPGWVKRARLLPLIQGAAQVVASLIPDQHVGSHGVKHGENAVKPAPKAVNAQAAEKRTVHEPVKPKKTHKKTYGAKDRHALDRLIEATGSDDNGKP